MKTTVTNKGLLSKATGFFGEVRQEASKVTWPARRETMLTAIVVFGLAVVAAIYFMIVDQAIYRMLRWIIG